MKTLAALITAFLMTAHAARGDQMMEHCTQVSSYAESAMLARQKGLPLSDTLGFVAELRERNASESAYVLSMIEMLQELVIMAYDRPAFRGESARQQAINEFSSNAMLDCIKEWRETE